MIKYIYDDTTGIKIIYKIDESLKISGGTYWQFRRCDEFQNKTRRCYPQFNPYNHRFKEISKEQANKLCKEWYRNSKGK